jgi:hypothetical protein
VWVWLPPHPISLPHPYVSLRCPVLIWPCCNNLKSEWHHPGGSQDSARVDKTLSSHEQAHWSVFDGTILKSKWPHYILCTVGTSERWLSCCNCSSTNASFCIWGPIKIDQRDIIWGITALPSPNSSCRWTPARRSCSGSSPTSSASHVCHLSAWTFHVCIKLFNLAHADAVVTDSLMMLLCFSVCADV